VLRSRSARVAAAALALCAAAAASLYLLRLQLATRWLERELAARGLPGASLRVTHLDPRRIALEEIALGPELGARELVLDLDLRDRTQPVRRLRLSGARLRLDPQPGKPLLGSLDAALRPWLAGASQDEHVPVAIPALEVEALRLLLDGGHIDVALELSAPGADESSTGEIRLDAHDLEWGELELGSARLELPFGLAASSDSVSIAWTERARAELRGLGGLPVRPRGPIQASSERGRIDVRLADEPGLSPHLEAEVALPELAVGESRLPASHWQVSLDGSELRARASALDDRLRAELRATLDPATGAGQARLALAPLEFVPGGLQPAELDPRLAPLRDVRGRVSGVAQLRWSGGALRSSSAELTLAPLALRSSGARVEGLRGVIQLSSLSPLASGPAQLLEATSLEVAGIRFAKPRVRFAVGPERLLVEEALLPLGSGKLRVRDAVLGALDAPLELTVEAIDLELAELLALAALEGVSGSGTLSGAIPLRVAGDAVEIRGARLESRGPGVLRVRSERVRSALGSAGETVEQLVSALEDFHYESLRIELEKPARGESVARLELRGNNPKVLEGRAFALNVNLETDLEPLLRAVGVGLEVTRQWR
jgi:hypothetical protein